MIREILQDLALTVHGRPQTDLLDAACFEALHVRDDFFWCSHQAAGLDSFRRYELSFIRLQINKVPVVDLPVGSILEHPRADSCSPPECFHTS